MKGLGGLGDMGRIMKQAQNQVKELQKQMDELDETLKERVVEGSAGGGMVKVLFNGLQEPLDVKIEPTILEEEDPEFLQEMILAAVRQGLKKAADIEEEEKSKLTQGIPLPGIENLL
ncbi:MAG: YbaB/EbfC family nucleoid-associated protein [Candidatus Brocadiia bacterium]